MEDLLKNICAEHGLTTISVTTHNNQNADHTTVFIHWASEYGMLCSYGTSQTFDTALDLAVAEKRQKVRGAA